MSRKDLNLYAHLARRMNLTPMGGRTVLQELNACRVPGAFRVARGYLGEELHDQARSMGASDWQDPRLSDYLARAVMVRARWADQATAQRVVARQLRRAGMDHASARHYAVLAVQEATWGWESTMSVAAMLAVQKCDTKRSRA